MLVYRDKSVNVETAVRKPNTGEIVWIHMEAPKEEDVKHTLGEVFGCHPLVIEDVLKFGQRPKLDHYPGPNADHAMLCFYALRPDFTNEKFFLVFSNNFIITVTQRKMNEVDAIYSKAMTYPETMESTGQVVYHLLDTCVDESFSVMDSLEEQIDELQEKVFDHPEAQVAKIIFQLKRQVHNLRRLASDGRNVIGMLSHETFPYTKKQHAVYFVDVYDHTSRVVDALDGARDNLSGLLDLQTAQRANQMNEVMKTLTIINTIFLPLAFIVGLYGMNVKGVPEYRWSFGYAYVWGLLIVVTAAFAIYFKKKKWF